MKARTVAVLGLTAALVGAVPAQAAVTPTPTAMSPDDLTAQTVPVLGSTTVRKEMDGTETTATVLVNAVRRIPGATVLYYSAGLPEGARPESWYDFQSSSYDRLMGTGGIGAVRLVDFSNEKIYAPLYENDGSSKGAVMSSPAKAWPDYEPGGTFYTFYAVMPELPADLNSVDVRIGHGDVVQNLPIDDGVLEPAVPQEEPIRMGEAWPQIDQAAAARSLRPQDSVRDLVTKVASADGSYTEETVEETTTVDLSSDVLFGVDSAALDPAAGDVLQRAADAVNEASEGGPVEIVGHTDSDGSDEHNLDLSKRRARAVARALKPLIAVSGVTYQISGRGEKDPVSGNDTEEGRKANRRVSVVFGPGVAK